MLTATQVEVVGFITDGGIICRDCATSRFGEMGVAAVEEGIAEFLPRDVSPICRFELDHIVGEDAAEHANEVVGTPWFPGYDETEAEMEARVEHNRRWDEEYQRIADLGYACDDCGEGIS